MGMQCTKSTLKVAFIMSLEWIWDCARNPAPLIACSSNGINSSVASPSARLLLQMGYSSLSLLILLSVSVHCCISMIEGLAFLCFRTEKTVNIEVVTRISSKEPNNFLKYHCGSSGSKLTKRQEIWRILEAGNTVCSDWSKYRDASDERELLAYSVLVWRNSIS